MDSSRLLSFNFSATSHPVQVKTLLRWANSHLKKSGKTLEQLEQLREGLLLIKFIQSVAQVNLECKDPVTSRSDNVANLKTAIDFLGKQHFDTKEWRIDALQRGDEKTVHSLVHALACRYHIGLVPGKAMLKARHQLLEWVRESIRDVRNMTIKGLDSGFHDGWTLASLVHYFKPNLLQLDTTEQDDPLTRTKKALAAANTAGVLCLIDAADLVPSVLPYDNGSEAHVAAVDSFSLLMYLTQMKHVFEPSISVGEPSVKLSPVQPKKQPMLDMSSENDHVSNGTHSVPSPSPTEEGKSPFKSGVTFHRNKERSPATQHKVTTHSPLRVSAVSKSVSTTSHLMKRLASSVPNGLEDLMQLLFREVESLEKERDDALQLAETLSSALDSTQSHDSKEQMPKSLAADNTSKQGKYRAKIKQLELQVSQLVAENKEQKKQLQKRDGFIKMLKNEIKQ